MKNFKMTWVLFLITFTTINFSGSSKLMAQPGAAISFQTFHDELQPYGQWVYDSEDGDIWIPNVERDFRPYATRGHWIVTDYGNTWVSDYDWGWAPFHYGRWRQHNRYGWVWIPGSEWGPAWVSWRSGGGYYGWAPLGPRIDISIGINLPLNLWVFVPDIYIGRPRVYDYCLPQPRIVNIYRNTTIINNIYRNNNHNYVYGPRPYEIERATRRPVQVYRVTDAGRPGNTIVRNGSVNIYRPDVNGRPSSRYDGGNRNGSDDRNTPNRGQDNNGQAGRGPDYRSRPDRTDVNGRTADTRREVPAAPGPQSSDRNSGQDRFQRPQQADRTPGADNGPDRIQRPQQADRTPAADNGPYRREGSYSDRNDNSRASREQAVAQAQSQARREEASRREAPQQQRQQSPRAERTQGRTEQAPQGRSESSQGRGSERSSGRERPSRS